MGAAWKILVFGETGQVARELRAQAPVTALGRGRADLADPSACADAIMRTDAAAVINAAAYTAVDRAEAEEDLAMAINGVAPAAMARACAARKRPFVHISTDYVFDGTGSAPWRPEDATGPLGAYGRTKLAGEEGVREAGGRHAILRTSWVFSAHGGNFVKTMLRLSETRDSLDIVADQVGGPTAASDIASACLTLAHGLASGQGSGQGRGGTYHFAGAPDVSWADFAREIFAQAGRAVTVRDIPAAQFPTKARRPANSRLDCTTLQQDFGIPRPEWRQSLAATLETLKMAPS